MFSETKYTTWYFDIIEIGKNRSNDIHGEKHHIIPKSLGGSNSKDNLVRLTFREHFLVHWLLTKMCEGKNKKKMYHAFWSMTRISETNKRVVTSYQYELCRKIFLSNIGGTNNPMYGKTHSSETRKLIKNARKDQIITDETKEKIRKSMRGKNKGSANGMFGDTRYVGVKRSLEDCESMRKPKSRAICPHCNLEGGSNALKRYHFDNCKLKV